MDMTRDVDWNEDYMNWENHGRSVIQESCTHKTQDTGNDPETNMRYSGYCEECGFSEDSAEPMMNFAYPLHGQPTDQQILEIVKQTNLTVMEDTRTEEFYLVLSGGGMDLSQDIALAYLLAGERIPDELAFQVCTQYGLSVSGKNYFRIMKACQKTLESLKTQADSRIERIKEAVKEAIKDTFEEREEA